MIKLKAFSSDTHYAFFMLKVKDNEDLIKLRSEIDKNDLYEDGTGDYGIETQPHVTIYPCMDNSTKISEVSEFLLPISEINIDYDGLMLFENDNYDVLVLKIVSRGLESINYSMSSRITSHSEYKDYNPHLTIAYLKKGEGKKYLESISDITLTPEYYFMSYYVGDIKKEYKFNK